MPQVSDYDAGHRYAEGKPGRYVCFSSFVIDGITHSIEHECNNPEVGRWVVWERENEVLKKIGAPTREVDEP